MILSVVGNKNDLESQRAVSREEAFLYASSIGGSYFETSAINGGKGIEQVFIATARGLLQIADDSSCSSIKRYNSVDSLLNCDELNGFYDKTNLSSVHLGIAVDPNVEANDTGRLETPSWSINHIAHGDEHRTGWCCFWSHATHCLDAKALLFYVNVDRFFMLYLTRQRGALCGAQRMAFLEFNSFRWCAWSKMPITN